MPSNPVVTLVDDNGASVFGSFIATIPVGAATIPIAPRKGRLVRAVVTTAAAGGAVTFFDNSSAGSGTVLAIVPGTAALGAVFDLQMPVMNGITAVAAASAAALTVSYS